MSANGHLISASVSMVMQGGGQSLSPVFRLPHGAASPANLCRTLSAYMLRMARSLLRVQL
jgi:hypothetical protein